MIISNKEQIAKEVSQIMHGFSKGTVEGFFRRKRRCWEKVLLAKLFLRARNKI